MVKNKILFIVLVVFSLFIRTIKLDLLPLFGDEIDVGYHAHSLATTLRDYKGNFLPTYIQSFTESRAPLLMYLSIPGVELFGLNEFGVRLTPAIFGVLSLIAFYLLLIELGSGRLLSFLGTFLMSITPWHLHYSRSSFEVTLLLFLILFGAYRFLKYLKAPSFANQLLFIIPFALTFYTYNTANIFVPLLALYLLTSNLKSLKTGSKFFLSSAAVSVLLIFPILLNIITGNAASRFKLISVFSNPQIIDSIVIKRTSYSAVSPKTETVFHNKLTAYSQAIYDNYFQSLSPFFIFFKGDPNPRHNIPNFGLIYGIFVIPFFIGLIASRKRGTADKFFLFWLLTSPLASALTVDGSTHPTRLFIMIPSLIYFIAKGSTLLLNFSRPLFLLFSLLILYSAASFIHEYGVHFPKDHYQSLQYGYRQLFEEIPQNSNRIIVSNTNYSSLPRFLFFQKTPPAQIQFQKDIDTEKPNILAGFSGFTLGSNVYFINNWSSPDTLYAINSVAQPNDTFVLYQGKDIPGDMDFSKKPLQGFKTIKTVYNPDSTIFGQLIQKQ